MKRREFMTSGVALFAAAAIAGPSFAAIDEVRVPPSFTGPITGGTKGWPQGSYPTDLAAIGYVEEEYFISGQANCYTPAGGFNYNGQWAANPAGSAPYTTRLLVHRPIDPAKFNGSVLVEWINVSPGRDNILALDERLYDGFIYVAASVQYVGLFGFANVTEDQSMGLVHWDRERYGSLEHPGDAYAYDIYSQIGHALRDETNAASPLAGYGPRKILGIGGSQSAAQMRAYINIFHRPHQAYDGYLPFLSYGSSSNLGGQTYHLEMTPDETAAYSRYWGKVREDLGVPVFIVNTEQEAIQHRGVEWAYLLQDDTDTFRLWEVAGAPHSPAIAGEPTIRSLTGRRDYPPAAETADGAAPVPPATYKSSQVTSWHVTIAAAYHLHDWVHQGIVPPIMPRLAFLSEGTDVQIIRDDLGLAVGGIRLPEVTVPIAMNTGVSHLPLGNRGLSEPFSPELLRMLYPDHADYVAKVTAAAQAAETAGLIRPYRTAKYISDAQVADIPPSA